METSLYETVHTIMDWYDGPRTGIADFKGKPHYYQCTEEYGLDEDYLLSPLDTETFQLALEDWAIWKRWQAAFDKGQTPHETHPTLPEDETRRKELTTLLLGKLCINPASVIRAKAKFLSGKNLVKWIVVTDYL